MAFFPRYRYNFPAVTRTRIARLTVAAIVLSRYQNFLHSEEHFDERDIMASRPFHVPFVDARVRVRHIEGDLWRPEMAAGQAAKYFLFKEKSPIYFYGRSCGHKVKGARVVVAKIADWSLDYILRKSTVPDFLLHVRFLVETYGWKIVIDREKEKRYILLIDFRNVEVTSILTRWHGLYELFRLARPSVKAAPLSWSKTCLLNAPYVMRKIISYGKSVSGLRADDVLIPDSAEEASEILRDLVGEECLPESLGGLNPVPLEESDVELAFQIIVEETMEDTKTQFGEAS